VISRAIKLGFSGSWLLPHVNITKRFVENNNRAPSQPQKQNPLITKYLSSFFKRVGRLQYIT
ncbi:MAG TPA: hypothetical protein PK880_15860, partial [Candidatus Competibacter sp.]|nr:hypothetical protein [Candidatus Competibacter sp.]